MREPRLDSEASQTLGSRRAKRDCGGRRDPTLDQLISCSVFLRVSV